MKLEFSSGGVVFKKVVDKGTYWLIARSFPSKEFPESYWRLPKGWIDDEKDKPGVLARGEKRANVQQLQEAALREVREEGGVEAKIVKKIGTKKIFFTKSGERLLKFVTYYLMEWVKDIQEGAGFETSEVGWFSYDAARERLKYKSEKEVLEKAKEILGSGAQINLI